MVAQVLVFCPKCNRDLREVKCRNCGQTYLAEHDPACADQAHVCSRVIRIPANRFAVIRRRTVDDNWAVGYD